MGNNDGITPSNIVGAIANEADISSRFIGSIKLHDDYSTVDLPEGMPDDLLKHLKKVRVCAKPMRLSVFNPNATPSKQASEHSEPRQPRIKKTLSRDVDEKRTADSQRPAKKRDFCKKKPAGGKFAKDKKGFAKGKATDGSSPIKKKKTYTKKPKKAKS